MLKQVHAVFLGIVERRTRQVAFQKRLRRTGVVGGENFAAAIKRKVARAELCTVPRRVHKLLGYRCRQSRA